MYNANTHKKMVHSLRNQNPSWREGQIAFNSLYITHTELAEEIRGAACDPYYKDKNLVPFYEFLATKQENQRRKTDN